MFNFLSNYFHPHYPISLLKSEIDFKNATFNSILLYENMFPNTSNLEVIVKDEAARSWMQSRLGSSGTAVIASS